MKKFFSIAILMFSIFSCSNEDGKNSEAKKSLYSIPDSLNFGVFRNKIPFEIQNHDQVVINYTITSSKSHVTFSQNSGNVIPNNVNEITVNVDRTNLPAGKSYSKLYLNINNRKDSIVVSVDNFKEQKRILDTDVIDAEYSKITNQLVYVSANPSKVNILTSGSGIIESIPLSYPPKCVSISQDGKTAVVGHEGHITYVNLNNKSVINTYNISCSAIDIVLGNDKWAYVFPEKDQWTFIRCVNLNLSEDNEGGSQMYPQIYAGVKAKLHPSGKYIYGANNGLSPSNIEKYNIQNGIIEYSYKSPYHGDYPMNGNIWFSEDGARIFTRGKTVFKTSEIKSDDMIYNGSINTNSNIDGIEWLDHSSSKNNLYLILTTGEWTLKKAPYIYVYDYSNLAFKRKIDLEKYIVIDNNGGGKFYDAEPFFVFSNSQGNNLFVITKATGAGLDREWSIQKITIE